MNAEGTPGTPGNRKGSSVDLIRARKWCGALLKIDWESVSTPSIKLKVSACQAKEREESITSRFCRLMDTARANEWGARKRHALNPKFITQR